jgi:gluconokinase
MEQLGSPPALVVMGVSASGKTTLGRLLAERLGWTFQEGDDLHPPANVAKMKAGQPLDDADRWPWLEAIGRWLDDHVAAGQASVVTCSALKRAYRDKLADGRPQVLFLYIDLDRATLEDRISHREGHFFPASLLDSQLATLQPPGAGERAIRIDGRLPTDRQADQAMDDLSRCWPDAVGG